MEEKDKEYSILQNFVYCIKATIQNYPKLLVLCVSLIVINAAIPVITTFLPKVVIDEIVNQKPLEHLMFATGLFFRNYYYNDFVAEIYRQIDLLA